MSDPFIIDGPTLWSFSGGRTSGYMIWRSLQAYGGKLPNSHVVAMANKTREDPRTLHFARRISEEFKVEIHLVEPVVNHDERAGSSHRVVSFDTALCDGSAYESVIQKYGIPNKGYPHCNRELKLNPIRSFLKAEMGWETGDYKTALGIRADEADRATGGSRGMVYPLVKAFIRKPDVYSFWKRQPFDLYVPEHLGNCVDCWKKSLRKHLTLAVDHPEVFDWTREMEAKYALQRPERGPQSFFRENMTVADIFARAAEPFEKFVDGREAFDPELDASGGACGEESCEIFADNDPQPDLFPRRAA